MVRVVGAKERMETKEGTKVAAAAAALSFLQGLRAPRDRITRVHYSN